MRNNVIPIESNNYQNNNNVGRYTSIEYTDNIFRSKGPLPVLSKNHKKKMMKICIYQKEISPL